MLNSIGWIYSLKGQPYRNFINAIKSTTKTNNASIVNTIDK